MSISKEYFGFEGQLNKGQIRKLRRASHDFSSKELPEIIKIGLDNYGISNELFEINVPNTLVLR
jgi:hypothetical protein